MIPSVRATEAGRAHSVNLHFVPSCGLKKYIRQSSGLSLLEKSSLEGDTPVLGWNSNFSMFYFKSQVAWDCSLKLVVNSI